MIHEDITEQKHAEEQMNELRTELLHSNRAGSMVELTGALAHELNHPLGSILNNANAARRILGKENPDIDEVREIIDDIISEDRRASDVILKLRALMKKTEIEFAPHQINDIVEEVLRLTHSELIIKNITLVRNLEEGLPKVKGERTQLQQVLLNLIINANDAMKESETKQLFVSSRMYDNKTILVSIKDTGHGIDEKDKEKLFKPFITTKKEGMGMGLSVCRTIIKEHGGDIWTENDPEGGASFFITLPLQQEKEA
jgi:signal transduction histidine kinase